jgi:hypothetical protein
MEMEQYRWRISGHARELARRFTPEQLAQLAIDHVGERRMRGLSHDHGRVDELIEMLEVVDPTILPHKRPTKRDRLIRESIEQLNENVEALCENGQTRNKSEALLACLSGMLVQNHTEVQLIRAEMKKLASQRRNEYDNFKDRMDRISHAQRLDALARDARVVEARLKRRIEALPEGVQLPSDDPDVKTLIRLQKNLASLQPEIHSKPIDPSWCKLVYCAEGD